MAAGLEQACHRLEVFGPILAAHRFDHFDRANRIKRRVGRGFTNVAVVLQTQISTLGHPFSLHPGIGPFQLLGAQGHADDRRVELCGGFFGQSAPAAANFKHPVAGLDARHTQCAPHFGMLGVFHGRFRRFKNRRRIVHGAVQPQLVKRIAEVVVGVNIFLAVGFGVAVQQVLDAVGKTAQPGAVNDVLDFFAVDDQNPQQLGQMRRGPVTGNIAFSKTDIPRLERGAADIPVEQVQAGHRAFAISKALNRTIG